MRNAVLVCLLGCVSLCYGRSLEKTIHSEGKGVPPSYSVTISGPTTALAGESQSFTATWRDRFNNVVAPPSSGFPAFWEANGGTVLSQNATSCTIQWSSGFSLGIVAYEKTTSDDSYFAFLNVSIADNSPIAPATTYTITNNCSATLITRLSNPPSDVDWFWQTTPLGTSTELGNQSTLNRTLKVTHNIYLRARSKSAPYLWSQTSQNAGEISVISPVTNPGTISSLNTTICSGSSAGLYETSSASGTFTYQWMRSSDNVNWVPINGATDIDYPPAALANSTYFARSATNICGSSLTNKILINVHPTLGAPSIQNNSICESGSIAVTPGTNANATRWYATATGGNEIPTSNNNSPFTSITTTYYLSSYNILTDCESKPRIPVTVTVNTRPNVAVSSASQATCSGQMMTTVNLTNPNGVSGTTYGWTVSAPNITGAGGGTASAITQTLSQTTSTNQTATYTITPTANGCNGTAVTHTVTVKPRPTIAVSSASQSACSGQMMAIVNITNPNGVSGTTYSWTVSAPNITGTSGGTASAIKQTLSQTTSTNQTATYTITPTANGCSGSAAIHTVTVKPQPTVAVSSASQSICSGQVMSSINLTNPNAVGGTTYGWTVSAPNITGASGGATSVIGQTLSQTTSTNQTATYTVTPTANSCSGTAVIHTVTVKPRPTVAVSSASQSTCSGQVMSTVNITNPNAVSGTTYGWTVSAPNISGASGGSTSAIAQTLSQTTSTNQTATYTITPTANGCSGTTVAHSVTVKPRPTVAVSSASQSTCSGQVMSTVNISNPNAVSGTTYGWTVSAPNISGASVGSASAIGQTLSQTTSTNQTATYTVTPTANGCSGTAVAHTVTVKPRPTVAVSSASQSICSGQVMSTVNITNPNAVSGTTYGWTVSAPNITGASGGSTASIAQTLSQTTPTNQTATYTVTPTANGCSGTAVTHIATVNSTSVGGTIASNVEAYGVATGILTLSGKNGAVQKWQQKIGSGSWTDIANTTTSLAYNNINTSTYYRAVVKSGVCAAQNSTETAVLIYDVPAISIQGNSSIPAGGSTTIASSSNLFSYQWYRNNQLLAGQSSSTLVVTKPGLYKVAAKTTSTSPVFTTGEMEISRNRYNPLVDMNYVTTYSFNIAGVNEQTDLYDLEVEDYSESTTYFDGLGRPVQSVALGAAGNGNDLISPVEYDAFGREAKKYLPYAHANRDGRYQPTALADQSNFYSNAGDKVADDIAPFSETIFEPSPLNRIIKQGSPGVDWQPNGDHTYNAADHTVKYSYEFNQANEVLQWTFTYPTEEYTTSALNAFGKVEAGTVATPVFYPANQLYKNKTKDEQGNQVIEYVDKEGRTILKRVQVVTGNPSSTDVDRDTNWASTYFIYDDFGNLVCVIPPEPSKRLATQYFYTSSTETIKNNFLKRWAFRYRYDSRQRMIMKQVPGAEPVYMVYDDRDRLVMTQDGSQRSLSGRPWTFTKYDALNRPIATGLKDTTISVVLTQSQMQALVNNFYAKDSSKYYEEYIGTAPGNLHGYSNQSFPTTHSAYGATVGSPNESYFLTLSYYDDYTSINSWGSDYDYDDLNLQSTKDGVNYHQPDNFNNRVRGQVTATKTKVLDGGKVGGYTWLKAVNYYDDKYRLIQSISDNYKGGTDRITNVFDFVGKVLTTSTVHITQDVNWKDLVNTTVVGNKLLSGSTFANGWGNSGAASVETSQSNQDVWMKFNIVQMSGNTIIGLTDQSLDAGYTTIDYGFYITGGSLRIYENGANKLTVGSGHKSGDELKIVREGTSIKYFKNNEFLYTSLTPSSNSLLVDVAFYHNNIAVSNVRTSFTQSDINTTRRFDYDRAGRLIDTWHSFNGQPEILLTHNEYNELGQLVDKKLHSILADASDAKQSVDYAYNIRGWLTHINDAALMAQAQEAKDYFGMELAYNTDLGTGNPSDKLQFNGNINAMKWSNNQGFGDQKENAYNFTYDPLNRLKTADFKQKDMSSWGLAKHRDANGIMQSVNAFKEHISSYDLNGNIMQLQRSGQDGSLIDDLTYSYGANPSAQSNKLFRVTDVADDINGFKELNSTIDDYVYDNNGNITLDRNKSTEELVANGEFDNGSANWTTTEPTRLSFVNSRIEISAGTLESVITQETLIKRSTHHVVSYVLVRTSTTGSVNIRVGSSSTNYSLTSSGSLSIFTSSNGTSDVKIIASPDFSGYIESISVHAATAITYNYLNLPETVKRGDEGSIQYIYTATGQKLAQVVTEGIKTKTTDYAGEFIYQNDTLQFVNHEEGRIIPSPLSSGEGQGGEAQAEYQYHLKDHLGNVRVTFTSVPEVEETLGTLETTNENEERANFLKYDDIRKVNSTLFDHTNTGSTQYAMRLSGTAEEKYGLARSIAVMPGDVLSAEVFAKYVDLSDPDVETFLEDLIANIIAGTADPGVVIDGGNFGSPGALTMPFGTILNKTEEGPGAPKAYLNWIVFDKNFVPIDSKSGFDRISTSAKENGGFAPEGVAHEQLVTPTIEITEPGYVYIYLSNEEAGTEVYFDDFKVTHTKSPVLEENFYYPFGMIAERNSREGMTEQSYLYNGKELQDELDLGWLDFGFRFYDPAIGKFTGIDPLATKYHWLTPYNYAENSPVANIDLWGLQRYYAANGSLLGQVGDNTDVRVVNSTMTNDQALENIQSGGAGSTQTLMDNSVTFADYFTTVSDVTNDAALQTYSNNGSNCFDAAAAQLKDAGVTQTGPGDAIQTLVNTTKDPGLTADAFGGAIRVQTELNNGNPVMVGVKETKTDGTAPDPGNRNSNTGHFVVIRSVTVAADGTVTFNYLDNAKSSTGKNANNNFTLNTTTGGMSDTTTPGGRTTYSSYEVSEVRKNN
ncbi:hypothetical protein SanaruYs_26250 [Chryseotalea sanaruensis]|uniref:Uncharacterized protein n=1 Tax=Chryseotalea sanaruensis TaxID=2482724 RepID=A0A401UBV1_9BACT|nr:PKD-like domain-containing protein [Chryseotalea sanaruensis]GCC52388.1 hypothetical protein SanaruYs_26250 [Chryseotalea sanaruensis]